MAQWYPKMVVYDDKGWHSEPFHAEGEFYGEFGTFDVTLEVPERFIVGATGEVVSGVPGWSSVVVDTTIVFGEWIKNFQFCKRHMIPHFQEIDNHAILFLCFYTCLSPGNGGSESFYRIEKSFSVSENGCREVVAQDFGNLYGKIWKKRVKTWVHCWSWLLRRKTLPWMRRSSLL